MKKRLSDIGFTILEGLLSLTARLPFGVLYLLSDITFALLYHVVRYRRHLVQRNLTSSFPDATPKKIRGMAVSGVVLHAVSTAISPTTSSRPSSCCMSAMSRCEAE